MDPHHIGHIAIHVLFTIICYKMFSASCSAGGHGWNEKNNWLSDKNVCDWDLGNLDEWCNGATMINNMDLHSNNLVGRIPVEITHLRMLGELS